MRMRRAGLLMIALAACLATLPTAALAAPTCETRYYPLADNLYLECNGLPDAEYKVEALDGSGAVLGTVTASPGSDGRFLRRFGDIPSADKVTQFRFTPDSGETYTLDASAETVEGAPTGQDADAASGGGELPYTGPSQSTLLLTAGFVMVGVGVLLTAATRHRGRRAAARV